MRFSKQGQPCRAAKKVFRGCQIYKEDFSAKCTQNNRFQWG